MPMEQRRAEILFERADLTADGGLAETQRLPGMRERARLRRGLKNAQLIPIHPRPRASARQGRRLSMGRRTPRANTRY